MNRACSVSAARAPDCSPAAGRNRSNVVAGQASSTFAAGRPASIAVGPGRRRQRGPRAPPARQSGGGDRAAVPSRSPSCRSAGPL